MQNPIELELRFRRHELDAASRALHESLRALELSARRLVTVTGTEHDRMVGIAHHMESNAARVAECRRRVESRVEAVVLLMSLRDRLGGE